MLFTLPADVRGIIWRKTRFCNAQHRLENVDIAPRHTFSVERFGSCISVDLVEARLNLPEGKLMIIRKRKHRIGFSEHVLVLYGNRPILVFEWYSQTGGHGGVVS